jgi:Undecaprenyl-phosphate glucose phosphotransferase
MRHFLQAIDVIVIVLAGFIGHFIRFGTFFPTRPEIHLFLYLSCIVIIGSLYFAGTYDERSLSSLSSQLRRLFIGSIGALLVILLFGYLSGTLVIYSRIWFVVTAMIGTALLIMNRIGLALFVRSAVERDQLIERVVLVGTNEIAERVVNAISAAKHSGIRITGIFEDRLNRIHPGMKDIQLLGDTDDLLAFVRTNKVDRIVVALPWINSDRINALLKKLRTVPVRLDLVANDVIWQFPAIDMERLAGIPILTVFNGRVGQQMGFLKRLEDIVISSLLIILTSPVLLLIAIACKLDSKGPVIFRQKRHGFNNKLFEVYKFRSMTWQDSQATTVVQATKFDPRVTRVGRILRRTSLDELPQLFNVLFGSMSIVGPRPHAVQHNQQFAQIITEYFARHNVKPGITGWAQVNGLRGETDTDDKMRRRVEFDLHYIEHWSLLLDLKIIFMTAVAVWFHETAY